MLMSPVLSTVLFAIARGLTMEAITGATGLTPDALVDPNARIDEAVMPRLWSLLGERFPGEALTLEMAAAAPPEVFGVVAHAAQYAADLRAALHLFIRYRVVLSSGLDVSLTEEPEGARLELYHPADLEDDGHASELGVAFAARLLRERLVGLDTAKALLAVEFAHAPLAPKQAYEDFFLAPVRFGARSNALVLRPSSLDTALVGSNAHMLRFVQAHLETTRERLSQRDDSPELTAIRGAVSRNAEGSVYSAKALAKRLGLSLRTLQRQARSLGISVQGLLDEAREANAREFLQDPRLSIAEIAFLLDYSTENTFARAFRRWTGETPAQCRRRLLASRGPS